MGRGRAVTALRRFRVTGRVQGVGFRAFTIRLGRSTGVRGAVRNEPDGSVVAVAEGSDEALERFRAGLALGPPGARVERVEESPEAADPVPGRFDANF